MERIYGKLKRMKDGTTVQIVTEIDTGFHILEVNHYVALKEYPDETAQQAYYLYVRSSYTQRISLAKILGEYITAKHVYEERNNGLWDHPERTTISVEITSFNPPREIRENIRMLYKEMVARNIPTKEESAADAKKRAIDEIVKNFFNT